MEPPSTHGFLGMRQSPQDTNRNSLPRLGGQVQRFCFLPQACLLCPATSSPEPLSRPPQQTPSLPQPVQISLHLTTPMEKRLTQLAANIFPFPGLQDPLLRQPTLPGLPNPEKPQTHRRRGAASQRPLSRKKWFTKAANKREHPPLP